MQLTDGQRPMKVAFMLAIILATPLTVLAQSGSRTGSNSPPAAGSGSATVSPLSGSAHRETQLPIGLQGYCPVCLVEMRQWIKGDARYAVDYDGKKYYFPATEQAEMFRQNPLKYVPVLGGDDIVQFARTGKRVDGKLTYGVVHAGRTYFFASEETKQSFQSSPESFENADLALAGECIVCRVDMEQRVPGSPKFTAAFGGLRYQFPGEEQMAAFLKAPARYVEALHRPTALGPAASGARPANMPSPATGGSGSR